MTIFSPSKQQGRVSYVKIGDDQQSVITHVSSALTGGLTKTHTYSLEKDEYGISITSTLLNGTEEKISGPINDSWTRFRESGKFDSVEWADAVDPSHKCGYAYIWLPDEDGKLPPKTKTFQPGTEVVIRRFLCVGTSPAQAYGRAMAKLGQVGKVSLTISDPDGNAISTARVDLSRDGKTEKFIPAYPDENGLIELSLPLGEWKLSTKDNGREKVDSVIIVKKDETIKKTISMSAQSGIHFSITKQDGSPTPCKAQIIGIEGTPSPKLGPVDRAHGCNRSVSF